MTGFEKLIDGMRKNPRAVSYADLCKVCDNYFGAPRQNGTSHRIYKMPWQGDPRVNIQKEHEGTTNTYQVKQVLKAIDRLEGDRK
jgi:hypothetical protein